MRVIGTAGHVDHGKSTLIAALTGIHPDRLKEEQRREMTIELGFGWMTLPNGEQVGIVDVPGHRDFIENMLSGIGGIDAALLVIAADEGVMPQTREHLSILDILQIPAGLIVLTKTDLVSDSTPEGGSTWLDLVEMDIRAAVKETIMKDAPIVRVSARNKSGLDSLISNLQVLLENEPSRPDLNRPRLPVDRVFTMSGFGTVVTGTLSNGHFTVGDEVEIYPGGVMGRIRGLQTHGKKEQTAVPGSRTAVNISGVDAESIRRGNVLAHPNQYQATRWLDARFRLLKDASASLKQNDEVKVFLGAGETIATIRLLDVEELSPGQEGWIQLEMREPVVAVRGDRYILRRPSPGETLGGGLIVDHQPKGRHKRFDANILKSLESLAQGSPSDILLEAAMAIGIAPIKEVIARSGLEPDAANHALGELLESSSLFLLEEGTPIASSELLISPPSHWKTLRARTLQILEDHHKSFPLRRGIPREELKSKLKLSPRIFTAVINKLVTEMTVIENSAHLAKLGHEIRFDHGQQSKVRELMQRFEQNPFSPPGFKDCQAEVGEEVITALIELGELIPVSVDVVFRKSDYDSMKTTVGQTILQNGAITLAEVRDLFNTSRKYAQALLEHFDATGFTVRDGDTRKLRK
ncbi:MAG TPA: selenocysteine-specific translation elongation factor [Anaerolineales bacterium]|nr:selenocysteine-specific translation elongation factor [Anaerolineales bacterium]